MVTLPRGSLLVRTWFGDDDAWERLARAITVPSEEGFLADVTTVDDRRHAGLDADGLRSLTPANNGASVSFIADELALTSEGWRMQVVALSPAAGERPFRVVATELWSVENNLNIANMDWDDFAGAADPDGVFRGFRPPPPCR